MGYVICYDAVGGVLNCFNVSEEVWFFVSINVLKNQRQILIFCPIH